MTLEAVYFAVVIYRHLELKTIRKCYMNLSRAVFREQDRPKSNVVKYTLRLIIIEVAATLQAHRHPRILPEFLV